MKRCLPRGCLPGGECLPDSKYLGISRRKLRIQTADSCILVDLMFDIFEIFMDLTTPKYLKQENNIKEYN